jgi:hypothetical protein
VTGEYIALGTCYGCKRTFGFDPGTVTVILIDPQTGRPPDVAADATRLATPTCPSDQCRQDFVCPSCVARANAERVRLGLKLIP